MKNYLCEQNFATSMHKKALLLLLFTGFLFTSCIPAKDLIYLQGDEKVSEQSVNPVISKPYRLQTNDILDINIKAIDPEFVKIFNPSTSAGTVQTPTEQTLYFNGFTIDDHGNIRLPLINEINVLGFTVEEVRTKIETRLLEEYFKTEANIFVTVKLAGFRYTINGEVVSPGSKVLFQDRVNIMEAIANAGDITVTGNRKEVTIIRQKTQGTEINTIDLTQRSALQSPYFYLQPNDYIYVKPLPQKTLGTGTTAMQSLSAVITVLSLVATATILLTR